MTAALRQTDPSPAAWRQTIVIALLATAITLAMQAQTIHSVLHGGFWDPDDAMRLVEVRAWMVGQPWFDVSAHRLDPPMGASMHWSRLVDLPVAASIALLGRIGPPALAEALARIATPTLLLIGLYAGMARLATILGGIKSSGNAIALVLGMVLSGVTLVQFEPGRIGHHAPETLCLVLMVASAAASFDPAHARQAGWAGALVALALSLSLETLPLIGGLCACMVAIWVWRGAAMARSLAWFAGALVLTLPILFFSTVGRDHWLAPVCDAYGAAHLGAGLIGALGCLGLHLRKTCHLARTRRRGRSRRRPRAGVSRRRLSRLSAQPVRRCRSARPRDLARQCDGIEAARRRHAGPADAGPYDRRPCRPRSRRLPRRRRNE